MATIPALASPDASERVSHIRYDIPAMSVRDALTSLARQAEISIAFEEFDLSGYRSSYVVGATTVTAALNVILSSTPYTFEMTGGDTIKLVSKTANLRDSGTQPNATALDHGDFNDVILVTAMKRMDDARTLPVAISAIDRETLERWGANDVTDLAPRIAGVAFTNLGTSRNKIFVRGLSDGPFADRTQSTVGVYLDETPIILNDTNPDLRLLDMERIEIVRGPQGSLYGGGTIGGLFRMITVKPDLDQFSGRLQVSGATTQGGDKSGGLDGIINIPIIEGRVGLRGLGYYQHDGGYIDDDGLDQRNVNSSQIHGGRAALRFAPAANWNIDAMFAKQNVKLDGGQYVFAGANGLSRTTQRPEPYKDAFNLGSLTVSGRVGSVRITSSTSYVRRETESEQDASGSLPTLLSMPGAGGVYRSESRISSFTHETRLASDHTGKWRWLVGGFFAARNEHLTSDLIVDTQIPSEVSFFSDRTDEVAEAALFGETAYMVSDALTLTLGARWARTTYEVDVVSGGEVNVGAPLLEVTRTDYNLSPKVAIRYQQNPALLLYVQASHGARIGGVNVSTPLGAFFDPDGDIDTTAFETDSLWNFESGMKSSWLDGDLELNASVFYVLWNEIQTDQFLPNGFSFTANAGHARNYGFEFESVIRPISKLELTAAFFWNSPELREANPFLGAAKGDTLPNIADVSAGLSATYEMPITGRWNALLTSSVTYIGRSFLTFEKDLAPSMGDYLDSNLRISVQRDALQAGLFIENVINERGNTFSFGNPFYLSAQAQETPLRPRTIGVFVRKTF